MNIQGFLRDLWQEFDHNPYESRFPRARVPKHILDSVEGMATESKLRLLNLAASHLEDDEIYLEVGCYLGLSLIGAMLGNDSHRFIGIDNFSEFGGKEQLLLENIKRFASEPDFEFINGDGLALLANKGLLTDRRIGVYFYDAMHRYSDQYRALANVEHLLADRSLIIVDDTDAPRVRAANFDYLQLHPRFRLLAEFRGGEENPGWWNGIHLIDYDRSRDSEGDPVNVALKRSSILLRIRISDLSKYRWYPILRQQIRRLLRWATVNRGPDSPPDESGSVR